jgi:hypothetical protein
MGDILQLESPKLASLPMVDPMEFNTIILALQKLPYEVSANLIHKLRAHVRAQLGELNAVER